MSSPGSGARSTWSPGINHMEWWASDVEATREFLAAWMPLIGWRKVRDFAFSSGSTEIYLVHKAGVSRADQTGVRHICFQAVERGLVDAVAQALQKEGVKILRGPIEVPDYSPAYYTVDFLCPDGHVFEVAHTPNMHV